MKKNKLRIGIMGAGLIGRKRAEVIAKSRSGTLVAVADQDLPRARVLALRFGAQATADWKSLVVRDDIDAVIVAVPNAFLMPIVLAALKNKKHVLCEKPFGINAEESRKMLTAAKKAKRVVKVGLNHRFHAGIAKAHGIFERGGIGKILFIRARYGHGGRKGMEKEWRFDEKISGGGELLDQGVHLVDLARWFGGEFYSVFCVAETKFWNANVDDNAFAIMRNDRVTASFHVSATNWKNIFSLEIFGDDGYLQVEGKGGSYGKEVLTWGKKNLGFAPDVRTFEFGEKDESWTREWKNFIAGIADHAKILGSAEDGLRASELIEALYLSSRSHKEVKLTRQGRFK